MKNRLVIAFILLILLSTYKPQKLYLNKGFKYINSPLGNTGHNACPVWMLKKLR